MLLLMAEWAAEVRGGWSGRGGGGGGVGGGGGACAERGNNITSKIAATLSHTYIDHFPNLYLQAYYVAQVCL